MNTEADQSGTDDVQVELPAANHEIAINYSCHYQDSLKIDDGRVIESTDTDGNYTPDQEIFCECGKRSTRGQKPGNTSKPLSKKIGCSRTRTSRPH